MVTTDPAADALRTIRRGPHRLATRQCHRIRVNSPGAARADRTADRITVRTQATQVHNKRAIRHRRKPLRPAPSERRADLPANSHGKLHREHHAQCLGARDHLLRAFPRSGLHVQRRRDRGETRGTWYVHQLVGAANIDGTPLFHLVSGNLSFQVEHHLYPDMPSTRYSEIAPKVKDICERYELPYNTGPFRRTMGNGAPLDLPPRLPWWKAEAEARAISRQRQRMATSPPNDRATAPQTCGGLGPLGAPVIGVNIGKAGTHGLSPIDGAGGSALRGVSKKRRSAKSAHAPSGRCVVGVRLTSVCECSVDDMQVDDQVGIHRDGKSIFVIIAIEEDERGRSKTLGDGPGKYPFSCNLTSLVPATGKTS